MKKIIALLLAAVMVMCLFAGCASSGGSKVIKIGVFEPQSGDNGAQGSPWAQGELAAKLAEGIRTFQISGHSDICNASPPSFASQMPPPLIVRGTTRGGFEGTAANPCCFANFKRKAFLPQPFKRSCSQIRSTITGSAYHRLIG